MSRLQIFWVSLAVILAPNILIAGSSDDSNPPTADGMFSVTPVLERSCIAIKVPITAMQALAGLRWYNNDDQTPFPKLIVASGLDELPPHFDDGVVVAEDLTGNRLAWSELVFSSPVASQSEALYVIFQLPPYSNTSTDGEGPGIGYSEMENAPCVFLSSDGNDWARMKMDFGLLVEPIIVPREPGVFALAMSNREEEDSVSSNVSSITALNDPFPNPCNPTTTIEFSLAKPGLVSLKVFDLRGSLVRSLANGAHVAGRFVVEWRGRNSQGAPVASGVYFIRLKTETEEFSNRVVLLK